MDKRRNGFAIALAWPETFCKQPAAWYNPIMDFLNITTNNHYQVGHAAVVLVDEKGECHYFDFGRYHAPFGFGRVRSAETDSELKLKTKATIQNQKILNFFQITTELAEKKACHGDGRLWSSYTPINFQRAKEVAEKMQKQSAIPYGPFILKGTNCSRFVRNTILKGNPKITVALKLILQYTLTASPTLNVTALGFPNISKSSGKVEHPKAGKILKDVLLSPQNPPSPQAKWFAGEGAGSWFTIEFRKAQKYKVNKYAPDLELESSSIMILDNERIFHDEEDFQLVFPCNSKEINGIQNGNPLSLRRIEDN
ncbi:DUF6695 family protein [Chryseobacterium sp. MP_3.2]|uniref:DUF6695 family protein n=1 Tax=Chryseobacterium sp. MP_3.2 TaxID=3071712 RepID=UPI002DFBD4EF|nr:hypothetical protein [Chryseobacterium sp. MP_3.2]